jgi:antibiotic biosynthesis monooxygenase (ABM) superfamily enzyme
VTIAVSSADDFQGDANWAVVANGVLWAGVTSMAATAASREQFERHVRFPDMNSLNAWYNSPEYQLLIALRMECTSDLRHVH